MKRFSKSVFRKFMALLMTSIFLVGTVSTLTSAASVAEGVTVDISDSKLSEGWVDLGDKVSGNNSEKTIAYGDGWLIKLVSDNNGPWQIIAEGENFPDGTITIPINVQFKGGSDTETFPGIVYVTGPGIANVVAPFGTGHDSINQVSWGEAYIPDPPPPPDPTPIEISLVKVETGDLTPSTFIYMFSFSYTYDGEEVVETIELAPNNLNWSKVFEDESLLVLPEKPFVETDDGDGDNAASQQVGEITRDANVFTATNHYTEADDPPPDPTYDSITIVKEWLKEEDGEPTTVPDGTKNEFAVILTLDDETTEAHEVSITAPATSVTIDAKTANKTIISAQITETNDGDGNDNKFQQIGEIREVDGTFYVPNVVIADDPPPPDQTFYDLLLHKTVTGSRGNITRDFDVSIVFSGSFDFSTVTPDSSSFTTPDGGVTWQGSFRHDESPSFNGIPAGAIATITEASASGYTTTVNGKSESSITVTMDKNQTVNFVNHRGGGGGYDPPDDPEYSRLSISKIAINGNDEYEFEIHFSGTGLRSITNNGNFKTNDNGRTWTGTIEGDKTVVFRNIPEGTRYTVAEETSRDYTTTVNGVRGSEISDTLRGSSDSIEFINTHEKDNDQPRPSIDPPTTPIDPPTTPIGPPTPPVDPPTPPVDPPTPPVDPSKPTLPKTGTKNTTTPIIILLLGAITALPIVLNYKKKNSTSK